MYSCKKIILSLALSSSILALTGCQDDYVTYGETAAPAPTRVSHSTTASPHYVTPAPLSPTYADNSQVHYGPPQADYSNNEPSYGGAEPTPAQEQVRVSPSTD